MTLSRYEWTYADGREYWYQYAYSYLQPDHCLRTYIYTDYDGGFNSDKEEYHVEEWSSELIRNSSCSQVYGYYEICTCKCCGKQRSYTYAGNPHDHYWQEQTDPEKLGLYYCTECGLENENGASGSIVMEDLTESNGQGTNYVVGYWNKTGVEVTRYVSVVLLDAAEGTDDEILLDVAMTELYWETDGITAISFGQAETEAAARTAMAEVGYDGAYAIRFTFVPVNAEDTLDYAITFASLEA